MGNDKIRELLEHRIAVAKVSADNEDYLIQFTIKEAKDVLALLDEPESQQPAKWLHKKCPEYVPESGKCKIKVPHRYNDYCEENDCPKIKPERQEPKIIKQPSKEELVQSTKEPEKQIYNNKERQEPCLRHTHREICSLCHEVSRVGFHVPDDIWRAAIHKSQRNKVICLHCFTILADERKVEWDKDIKFYPVSQITDACSDSQEPAAETVKYKELFESENLENEEKVAYFYLRTLELEREIKRLQAKLEAVKKEYTKYSELYDSKTIIDLQAKLEAAEKKISELEEIVKHRTIEYDYLQMLKKDYEQQAERIKELEADLQRALRDVAMFEELANS